MNWNCSFHFSFWVSRVKGYHSWEHESQNELSWKAPTGISDTSSCPWSGHPKTHTMFLRALSKHFLNSLRLGATALGSLFQHPTGLWVKNFFLRQEGKNQIFIKLRILELTLNEFTFDNLHLYILNHITLVCVYWELKVLCSETLRFFNRL